MARSPTRQPPSSSSFATYASSDAPVGIRPAGSTIEFISNNSTAWQVWHELVVNAEKAAARIYLGTDGTLGSQGGAPGVDISELFGVASTHVQGDLACLERGILTGVIEPWCAMNWGDSTLAPIRKYLMPDPDKDAARASDATRTAAFFAEIEAARSNGFAITPEYVQRLGKKHGVETPPIAPSPVATPSPPPTARELRSIVR